MIRLSRLHSFRHCSETRVARSKCSTLLPTPPNPQIWLSGHNPPGKAGRSSVGFLNGRVRLSPTRSPAAPPMVSRHGWRSRSLPRPLPRPSPRSLYPRQSTSRTTPARNRRGRPGCPAKWTPRRSGRRSGD